MDICVKLPSFEIIGKAAVENADTFAKELAFIDSKNDNFFDTECERLMALLQHDTNAKTNAQFKTYIETVSRHASRK
jgi:hypothetical protein